MLIAFTPPGQAAFGTAPLPASVWLLAIGLALAFGLLGEARKWLGRHSTRPRLR